MLVTGTTSNSRLTELKKYAINVPFSQQYVSSGSLSVDGVDYPNSVSGITMTYYIGGIKFIDNISAITTTFIYIPTTFIYTPIIYTGVTTVYPTYTAVTTTYTIGTDPTIYDATPLTSKYSGNTPYYTGTTIYGDTIITTDNKNFVSESYYKNPNKSKIISNPKINDDVFIIRDDLSALDKNYRLEYIKNMVDLTTYAGGKYFNIINNT